MDILCKICIKASENLKPQKSKCNNKKYNNEVIEQLSKYQIQLRTIIEKETNKENKVNDFLNPSPDIYMK